MLPGARQALRRIGAALRRGHLHHRVHPLADGTARSGDHPRCGSSTPGVDVDTFRPDADGIGGARPARPDRASGDRVRVAPGAAQGPGPARRRAAGRPPAVPDAALLLVGSGPYEADLRALAGAPGWPSTSCSPVGWPSRELPEHYAAGDVFAMPCRTRRRGLDVEGLGMVFLEASATGLPVVAGDSGGRRRRCARARPATSSAAATPPRSPTGWSRCCATPDLRAPARPRRSGLGRAQWTLGRAAAQLRALLTGDGASGGPAAGVERGDLVRALLVDDVALELQRRGELAALPPSSRRPGS